MSRADMKIPVYISDLLLRICVLAPHRLHLYTVNKHRRCKALMNATNYKFPSRRTSNA